MVVWSLGLRVRAARARASWGLFRMLESAVEMQQSMGASQKDTDDLRSMFTDNHPAVLLVTMIVSVVHMLLDVLAIKNDIAFWRAASNLTGISVHTLATSLICDTVVRSRGGRARVSPRSHARGSPAPVQTHGVCAAYWAGRVPPAGHCLRAVWDTPHRHATAITPPRGRSSCTCWRRSRRCWY